jgi:hypothetical protein
MKDRGNLYSFLLGVSIGLTSVGPVTSIVGLPLFIWSASKVGIWYTWKQILNSERRKK